MKSHIVELFTIILIIGWLMVNYVQADYSHQPLNYVYTDWDNYYYVAAKTVECLLTWIVALNSSKKYRQVWKILARFFLVRVVWQILCTMTDVNVNYPEVIFALFLGVTGAVTVIILKQFLTGFRPLIRKWRK